MTWVHGTTTAIWEQIRNQGIDFDSKRRSDPGDFGWGFYVTTNQVRAQTYGEAQIEVGLDESKFAVLPHPYFLNGFEKVEPQTEEEKLFHSLAFSEEGKMLTLRGTKEERETVCKKIRDEFLKRGYLGIITPHSGGEAVVFSPDGITSMSLCEEGGSDVG